MTLRRKAIAAVNASQAILSQGAGANFAERLPGFEKIGSSNQGDAELGDLVANWTNFGSQSAKL